MGDETCNSKIVNVILKDPPNHHHFTLSLSLSFSLSLALSHTLTGRSSHAHVPCSPSSPSCHLSVASASPKCHSVPPKCHLAYRDVGRCKVPRAALSRPPPTPRPGGGRAWAADLRNLIYRLVKMTAFFFTIFSLQ